MRLKFGGSEIWFGGNTEWSEPSEKLAGIMDVRARLWSDAVVCVGQLLLMAVALIRAVLAISFVGSPIAWVSCAKPIHCAESAGCSGK